MISHSKRGRLKEKADAKRAGGILRPNSGSHWNSKGDWLIGDFLVDSKSTKNDVFYVTTKIWEKVRKEALLAHKKPALRIGLGELNRDKNQHVYEVAVIECEREVPEDVLLNVLPSKRIAINNAVIENLYDDECKNLYVLLDQPYVFEVMFADDFTKYALGEEVNT